MFDRSKPLCPVCLGQGRLKVMRCARCDGTGTVKPNPYSIYVGGRCN